MLPDNGEVSDDELDPSAPPDKIHMNYLHVSTVKIIHIAVIIISIMHLPKFFKQVLQLKTFYTV